MSPKKHLVAISKVLEKPWSIYDQAYFAIQDELAKWDPKKAEKEWPAWCWSPHDLTLTVAKKIMDDLGVPLDQDSRFAPTCYLHMLAAWRPTQGVYIVQELPPLAEGLGFDAVEVFEALKTLPEPCPYICLQSFTPEERVAVGIDHDLIGFFVRLDSFAGERVILFGLDTGKQIAFFPYPVKEAPELSGQGFALIALALSVCTPVAHYFPGNAQALKDGHQPAEPQKTRNGLRWYPPDSPRVWDVRPARLEELSNSYTGKFLTIASEAAAEQSA